MNATTVNKVYNPSEAELSRLICQIRRERAVAIQKACAAVVAFLTLALVISTIIRLNMYVNTINNLTRELEYANRSIETLTTENITLQSELNTYKELAKSIPAYKQTVYEQEVIIENLMDDNTSLAEDYNSVVTAYDELKHREELYDKYSYAIMYDGERTDLTYDQIKYGESLMLEKGIDPNLLFSIGMVESKFDEDAKNKYSTASGYYQFLQGTGRYVYESLLGKDDSYNHSYAMDGYKSTEMAVEFLSYLNNKYNGNLFRIVKHYRGADTEEIKKYMNKMNEYLAIANTSTLDIAKSLN